VVRVKPINKDNSERLCMAIMGYGRPAILE
jgi:hypothetical protein